MEISRGDKPAYLHGCEIKSGWRPGYEVKCHSLIMKPPHSDSLQPRNIDHFSMAPKTSIYMGRFEYEPIIPLDKLTAR